MHNLHFTSSHDEKAVPAACQTQVPWNPVHNAQAIARIHRMGQANRTNVYWLLYKNTMVRVLCLLFCKLVRLWQRHQLNRCYGRVGGSAIKVLIAYILGLGKLL